MATRLLAGASLLAAVGACGRAAPAAEVNHPTAENLLPLSRVTAVFERAAPRGRDEADLVDRLNRVSRGIAIGSAGGGTEAVFSRIVDATVTNAGEYLVLDRSLAALRVFDKRGAFLAEVHGPTSSPFRSVEIVESLPDGRIAVIDKSSPHALKFFTFDQGTYQISRTFAMDVWPEDMCALGSDVFVLGLRKERPEDGGLIHRYSAGGELLGSFASPYKTALPIARKLMSQGLIACDSDGTVIVVLKRLPYVMGFDRAGNLKWTSRFGDFQPPQITQTGESFHISGRGTFDLPTAAVGLMNGHALIQVARVTRSEKKVELHSYLISTSSGTGIYVGTTLPAIVGGRWPRLLAVEREPDERIVEYKGTDLD